MVHHPRRARPAGARSATRTQTSGCRPLAAGALVVAVLSVALLGLSRQAPETRLAADVSSAITPAAGPGFCAAGREASALVPRIAASLTAPERVRGLFDQLDAALTQALDGAPSGAVTPLQSLQSTLGGLEDAMAAANYDVDRLSADMVAEAGSPEVFGPLRRLDAEMAASC